MHYASVTSVSKSFGIRTLFKNISFSIEEGDKIALVARNGTGKTTLLKMLAGNESPDEGEVWIHKDVKVILLEQETAFPAGQTIREYLTHLDNPVMKVVREYESAAEPSEELVRRMDEVEGWSVDHEMKKIAGKLMLPHLGSNISALSGGQRKRVALTGALTDAFLYGGNSLLIMDEPTNHLDTDMIEWLEEYLSAARITILLVTHDRYFLDAVCNEIIELEDEKQYMHRGKYAYFLEQKALRQENAAAEMQKDKNIYRRELEWMRKQPRARTVKSKSRQDAFTDTESRVQERKAVSEVSLNMKMTRLGGKVLELKKVYKAFGEKKILQGFDYTFKRGERIGIVGKNGTGKSTFIRIALQEQEPDSGKVNHGDTVVFGHFSQESLAWKEDKRAIDFVKDIAEYFPQADGGKLSAGQFMEKFGFTPQQQFTTLSRLSGGEKRRLQLLAILFRNPNFLVLDEPTNDLDLQTLGTLEEFLLDFPGCLLIVSHDRYFMDRLTDHLFVFEGNGVVTDFPGTYTQYRNQHANAKNQKPTTAASPGAISPLHQGEASCVRSDVIPKKLSFKEKFEFDQLEKALPTLNAEKTKLESELGVTTDYEKLKQITDRLGVLSTELDEKEMRWLELSEKI